METFTVPCKFFTDILATVGRVITNRVSLPVLEYFQFVVNEDQITVTGSDSEIFIQGTFPLGNIPRRNFYFLVPARTLLDGLKEITDESLTFEIGDDYCKVVYGNGHFQIPTMNGRYPDIPKFGEDAVSFELSPSILAKACTQLNFFADSTNADLYPALSGVHFRMDGTTMDMVATNRTMLAVFTVPMEIDEGCFTITSKTSSMLANLLKADKSIRQAEITQDGKFARFTLGRYVVTARLIDAKFPNYLAIIPVNQSQYFQVDRQALIAALKRCMVFCNDYGLINFVLSPNKLVICGENIDFAQSSTEEVPVLFDGRNVSFRFNGGHLATILRTIEDAEAVVCFDEPNRPFRLMPDKQDDDMEMKFILMPFA